MKAEQTNKCGCIRWLAKVCCTTITLTALCLVPAAALADNDAAPAAGEDARKNLVEMQRQLTRAQAMLDAGDVEPAVKNLNMVCQLAESFENDPKAAEALAQAQQLLQKAQAIQAERQERREAAEALMAENIQAEREAVAEAEAQELYELAVELYDQKDLEGAVRYAEQALAKMPEHRRASRLRAEATRQLVAAGEEAIDLARDQASRQVFQDLDRDMIPQNELLTYPEDWERRGAPAGKPDQIVTGAASEWQLEMTRQLSQPVSVEVQGTPLTDVISYLRDQTGVSIMIDPTCPESTQLVDFEGHDMRVSSVLNRLCKSTNTHWAMANKMVLITREILQDNIYTAAYPVHDLIAHRPDFGADSHRLSKLIDDSAVADASTGRVVTLDDGDYERKIAAGEALKDFISGTIGRGTWHDSAEGGSSQNTIAFRNGRLVITHTPEVHREILELLESFRRSRNVQVSILMRFIDMEKNFLDYIGVEFGGLGDPDVNATILNPASGYDQDVPGGDILNETGPHSEDPTGWGDLRGGGFLDSFSSNGGTWTHRAGTHHDGTFENDVLGDEAKNFYYHAGDQVPEGMLLNFHYLAHYQVRAILEAVVKRRKGTVLDAPRITCFNGQRANIVVTVEEMYVRNITEDRQTELAGLTHGVVMEVVPYVSSDLKYITIELLPTVNKLLRWEDATIQDVDETDTGTVRVTTVDIRLPFVSVRAIETTVTVPDGGTMLVGGMATSNENQEINSVPILENIPIVKWLFTGKGRDKLQTSLVILVRGDILLQGEEEPQPME